jgi:ribosomal protein S18 acetylase RimI-like enzyme
MRLDGLRLRTQKHCDRPKLLKVRCEVSDDAKTRRGCRPSVKEIRLRPMTAAEFGAWRASAIPGYAAAHERTGGWSAERAKSRAERQTDRLLPAGPETPGMLLLSAETLEGAVLGMVWIALDHPSAGFAWIYEIEIFPEHRGEGYGRALLGAAEQEIEKHGITDIGLNVFGTNVVARGLYDSSGYEVAAIQMRKRIAAD